MSGAQLPTNHGQQQSERFHQLSQRYLANSLVEARGGRWLEAHELMWASVTAALKAVAWSRGINLENSDQVEVFASSLASETGDRRIRASFSRLADLSSLLDRAGEGRGRYDRLGYAIEEIHTAVQHIWRLLPTPDEPES